MYTNPSFYIVVLGIDLSLRQVRVIKKKKKHTHLPKDITEKRERERVRDRMKYVP